jgi:hypothetical protein
MAPATGSRWLRVSLASALVVLLAGRWIADHTANRLWAESLGVGTAHGDINAVRLMLLALAFTSAALWCVGNVYLFYRSIGSVHVPRRVGNIEFLEAVPRRYLLVGAIAVGLLLAIVVSHRAGGWWTSQALLDEGSSIGTQDPILNRDLGYYLFVLPWYRTLHSFATLLTGTMLAVVTLLYAGVGSIRWTRRRLQVGELARMHLAGLFAAFALALFWGYRLEPAEYVAGIHGVALDATLMDVRIPVARLLAVLALIAAGISFAWLWVPSVGMMAGAWTVVAVVSLVGHYALPAFSSSATSGDRPTPIEIDRAAVEFEGIAYGLTRRDSTLGPPSPGSGTLAALRPQLSAGPSWDPSAVISSLNAVRPADGDLNVRFHETTLGLYRGSRGQPVPIYLSTREVDFGRAREANVLTWEREHTIPYGHTTGAVAVAAGAVGSGGVPLFAPAVEPADSATTRMIDVRLADPDVFFSPAAGDFAIVAGSAGEFVGVPASGFARRLALAWALQSPRLVTSDLLTTDVLVLWERQISARLARYAPFADFGSAYPVIAGGRLYWLASGYVTGSTFPFSRAIRWRGNTVRYLRAGFIGVVDAHSGATSVHLLPETDPVSAAWGRHLPQIVRPFSALAPNIATHIRYPEELFDAQTVLIRGPVVSSPPPAVTSPGPRQARSTTAEQLRRNRAQWWSGPWARDTAVRLRVVARFEAEDASVVTGLIQGTTVGGRPSLEVLRFAPGIELYSSAELAKRLAGERTPAVGVAGPRRTVVAGDAVLAVQSMFASGDPATRLVDVMLQWGPLVSHGSSLAAALEQALRVPAGGTGSVDWNTARRWFDLLEQARLRGDWAAFGRAYDALRRLLTNQ